jgi:hypothetical protein
MIFETIFWTIYLPFVGLLTPLLVSSAARSLQAVPRTGARATLSMTSRPARMNRPII